MIGMEDSRTSHTLELRGARRICMNPLPDFLAGPRQMYIDIFRAWPPPNFSSIAFRLNLFFSEEMPFSAQCSIYCLFLVFVWHLLRTHESAIVSGTCHCGDDSHADAQLIV